MRWFGLFLIFFMTGVFAGPIQQKQMSPQMITDFVQKTIKYNSENLDPNMDYSKYISKNYIQYVNGETMNFEQWVKHMRAVKAQMKQVKVVFEHILVDGNQVATVHNVYAEKKDGQRVEIKIISYLRIADAKLAYCDELTRVVKGPHSDIDIELRS